ncbi:MAG: SOS response-associated peptidase [Anaerolineae bacterium]|nr:SOS response-associated peptidase [Anaerolineae bacterium]MDW8071774.1 SOS response-associated peptidase [Anaerolineae bacterium]
MCGRFVLYSSLDEIVRAFNVQLVRAQWHPRYNIAPMQPVLVVRYEQDVTVLDEMRWGLIPYWVQDFSLREGIINARAETLHRKPSFKRPFASQRCLVVADGFYEWRKSDHKRIPFFFRLSKRRPFGFAGIYDIWHSPKGDVFTTCAIVTTNANALIRPLHDRMPVILSKDAETLWLNPRTPLIQLMDLLRTTLAEDMEGYEVSSKVNSSAYDAPECILPLSRTGIATNST